MAELKRDLSQQLGQNRADLVFAFLTADYVDGLGKLPQLVADHLSPGTFVGCTASGVIGGGREVEDGPAFSMIAASLPGVEARPLRIEAGDLPDLDTGPENWIELMGVPASPTPHFMLLADPGGAAAFDPRPLLMGLDFAYPPSAKIGGLASVMEGNFLLLDSEVFTSGCVGVALSGNIAVDTVVAQGCRPIGEPLAVTGCSGYYLTELDDRPAVEVLVELYHSLEAEDQELFKRAPHIGIASTELKEELGRGDFLIRNVMRLDQQNNIIAVGDMLRPGQTVQFHLRDGHAAAEDLDLMLRRYRDNSPAAATAGALLFTCTGRGRNLFGMPNHDSGKFTDHIGEVPIGGFFCGGEFGQVGGSTYLHGYTSSFALFRPRE